MEKWLVLHVPPNKEESMKIKTTGLLSALITLFLASEALGGWVTEEVTTYGEGARDTTVCYLQSNKAKTVG
jgi:hypothetical protein